MGAFEYYPISAGDCNYGAILPIRSELYQLYVKARETVNFDLEQLFIQYPGPIVGQPIYLQELYISDADRNPNFFSRSANLDCVLEPQYARLELAKKFGLDRLAALKENWLGNLHDTGSFEVNSCAYQTNGVIAASQWYAFERREEGENFKLVFVDYGWVDLSAGTREQLPERIRVLLDRRDADGKMICDKRTYRA
ncbi:hypothetical protein Clacol_000893 [Clathrus columnatus]|uniref:Uncharacterized protein n=1 Tax=Clathrus columnatus TaxID=1419009 RepID=A0AAV5A0H9_9AGAM|nr:hypothetical protein Clacol_000893 [Clathrus columnatus]